MDQPGGRSRAATPAPISRPNAKTRTPITISSGAQAVFSLRRRGGVSLLMLLELLERYTNGGLPPQFGPGRASGAACADSCENASRRIGSSWAWTVCEEAPTTAQRGVARAPFDERPVETEFRGLDGRRTAGARSRRSGDKPVTRRCRCFPLPQPAYLDCGPFVPSADRAVASTPSCGSVMPDGSTA